MATEFKNVRMEVKAKASERLVEGYASTWDRDQSGDVIQQGAFKKTVAERGPEGAGKIKTLWQHFEPLGVPVHMEEDSTGLFTVTKVSKTRLGDEALELVKDGVVDSMSIGFVIPGGKAWMGEDEEGRETRYIGEVKLFEYSLVTFACNEAAMVSAVKALTLNAAAGETLSQEKLQELRALVESLGPRQSTSSKNKPAQQEDEMKAAIAAIHESLNEWRV